MSAGPATRLETGLQSLGFEGADVLAKRLLEYANLLLDANRRTNLVGAKSTEELIATHLLDSLAPLAKLKLADPVIDLGSGAGLPGIPAALACPRRHFVLIEPRAKRARFLEEAVAALGLRDVEVVQTSAGAAAQGSWRGHAGTVLARALAKPAVAVGLALPLLRPGGTLVVYTGRASRPTAAETSAIHRHAGRLVEARQVVVPYLDAQRHVWIIERVVPRPNPRNRS